VFAGRGADDFGESGRPRARPSHVALAHVGVVMGSGGVVPDEPGVVPGGQPVEIRDAAAAGADGPGDRLLGRRQAAEGIRGQRDQLQEARLRLADQSGGALVPQVLPVPRPSVQAGGRRAFLVVLVHRSGGRRFHRDAGHQSPLLQGHLRLPRPRDSRAAVQSPGYVSPSITMRVDLSSLRNGHARRSARIFDDRPGHRLARSN